MSDWSKDIDLEVIKEYLRECAENDDYHYEQYQIDIIMHEYIRQNQEIERLNNIINELEKDLYDNAERCKDNFNETQDIKWLDFIEIYNCIADKLQELKGDGSNE